ncbi:MAG: FAD-dependent oxidoreductase [Anaerolineales bacterium]|jgi:NADPH-dependent 2,4-dienoyl-CoA reductase/sulfur reductase-like enzyme
MRYVVIGSGVAGYAACEAIRSQDSTGEIFLVSDDPHGYYSRPGLAYYLTGEMDAKGLFPRSKNDWLSLNLHYKQGRVTRINLDAHKIELGDGSHLGYDRLLLAVGAQANRLDIPGVELEGVVKLDHMEDARYIRKLSRRGKRAVVVGGGITALELVEGLISRKVRVHYLLRGDRYWSNVLDEQESRIIEQRLKEEGVKIHYHSELKEVLGKRGKVHSVRTLDGGTLPCDILAYAIGIRPRVELARGAGLAVERGVLANEYLQTSNPDIYAAGDVAQVYDPASKHSIIDSLWGPAREQGYMAGLNMTGKQTVYVKKMPFNVTRLAGLTTTIIGTVGRGRDEDLVGIARGDSETWRSLPDAIVAQTGFEVNRLRLLVGERTLLGAIVMGDQQLSFPLEKIISNRADISSIREKLLHPNAPIGDIIADFWRSRKAEYAS